MSANDEPNNKLNATIQKFNWALFLGLCIVALSVFFAGQMIAGQIPQTLHGSFSGSLMGGNAHFYDSPREFMTEWEAARFIGMNPEEFTEIVESGELSGTYTAFQVERQVWQRWDSDDTWIVDSGVSEVARPMPIEYDIVIVDHRMFSRERLAEWLLARMDR